MTAQANIKAVITADDKASATLKNFGKQSGTSFAKMAGAVAVGTAALQAFKAITGKTIAIVKDVIKTTLDWSKGTLKLQRELGITAKSASGLMAVGKRFGLSVDQLSKSFGIFAKRVTEAGKGNKTAIKDFKDFGISVRDSNGKMKDFDALFGDVADKFKDAPNGFNKTAEAMRMFGRSGKDMLPILNLGSEGIKEIMMQAEKFGLILTEKNVEQVKAFIKGQREMEMAMTGVKLAIGTALLPALAQMGGAISNFVASDQFKQWLTQLTNWLQVNLPIAINYVTGTLIPNLINIFNALWPTIKIVFAAFNALLTFLANNKWVVVALTAAFVALKVAMAISKAVAAFQAGMAAVRGAIAVTKGSLVALRALAASSMIMGGIVVTAALASLALVAAAIMSIRDAIRDVNNAAAASASHSRAQSSTLNTLKELSKNGTPAQKARANRALRGAGGFATGTDFAPGGATLVGERGPEMVSLPRGAKVHQADKTRKMGGGNTTINITVPMMSGSANERRKVARMLIKDLQDIAAMNGKSVTDMLSSNYGLVS